MVEVPGVKISKVFRGVVEFDSHSGSLQRSNTFSRHLFIGVQCTDYHPLDAGIDESGCAGPGPT